MTLKGDVKFEEKLACGLENRMRNWQIFTRALESLKIRALMGYFYQRQKIDELKIYRRVMCHINEERCKI